MTETAIKERFLQAFDRICHDRQLTQVALSEEMGINTSYISIIRKKDNTNVKASVLAQIVTDNKVSANWLLTGKGKMFGEKIDKDILQRLDNIDYNIEEVVTKMIEAMLDEKPKIKFSKS